VEILDTDLVTLRALPRAVTRNREAMSQRSLHG